jgi:hypothetical protein
MEKDKAKQVIQAEIDSTNTSDLCDLVYELIVEKEIDKKSIRNKVIKEEFNQLYRTAMPIMEIYGLLSCTHDISERTINYIISK